MTDYVEQENFAEGYQKSVEDLKNRPDLLDINKRCHKVFTATQDGKELLKIFEQRYIVPALCHPNVQNYETLSVYFDGFKEAFRMIIGSVRAHEDYIKAESLKKESKAEVKE